MIGFSLISIFNTISRSKLNKCNQQSHISNTNMKNLSCKLPRSIRVLYVFQNKYTQYKNNYNYIIIPYSTKFWSYNNENKFQVAASLVPLLHLLCAFTIPPIQRWTIKFFINKTNGSKRGLCRLKLSKQESLKFF